MSEMRETPESANTSPAPSGPSDEQVAEWQKTVRNADPELSEWVDFKSEAEKKGADLCRSAANALITVVALLFAGFVAFLRVSEISNLHGWRRELVVAPLLLWALAGAALVWFVLPSEWSSVSADGKGIKTAFLKFVKSRKRWLRGIGVFILLGTGCAITFIATIPSS